MDDQTAGRFMRGGGELQGIGCRLERQAQMERARRVEPLQVDGEVEPIRGTAEAGAPLAAQTRGDAQNILAEGQVGERKRADHHLHRQAGQQRLRPAAGGSLLRWRGFGGRLVGRQRLAQQFQMTDFKPVDDQSPQQQ